MVNWVKMMEQNPSGRKKNDNITGSMGVTCAAIYIAACDLTDG